MLDGSRTKFYQKYVKDLAWKEQISSTTKLQESVHDDDDDDDDDNNNNNNNAKTFVQNTPFSLSSQFDICTYICTHARTQTCNSAHLVCF
jgi:hypothetical protein